jgi:hypothetical protein
MHWLFNVILINLLTLVLNTHEWIYVILIILMSVVYLRLLNFVTVHVFI